MTNKVLVWQIWGIQMNKSEILAIIRDDDPGEGQIQMRLYQRDYSIFWSRDDGGMTLDVVDDTSHSTLLFSIDGRTHDCVAAFVKCPIWGPAHKTFEQIREPDTAMLVDT